MKTKVSRQRIVKDIKGQQEKDKRGRVTLYLNLKLYEAFQEACGKEDIPASVAIEKLMEAFLE